MPDQTESALRRAVLVVALANLGYFGVEFSAAISIGSVSLFADSIDFLEDATVNLLILMALRWPPHIRSVVGMGMAGLLMVPSLAALWSIWEKLQYPEPPEAVALSITGFGALVVNVGCALLLARFRNAQGSLTKAAFLSARNDAIANIAIISTGALTALTLSAWPDLVVGLGIAVLNANAAFEVLQAARREHPGIRR